MGDSVKVAHVTMRIKTGNINVDDIQTGGLGVSVSDSRILNQYAYRLGYCGNKTHYQKHPDIQIVF